MDEATTLRVTIPAGASAPLLVEAALRAIVARTDGIAAPAALLEFLVAEAGAALKAAATVTSAQVADSITITLDDALQTQNPDPIVFGRGGLPLSAVCISSSCGQTFAVPCRASVAAHGGVPRRR